MPELFKEEQKMNRMFNTNIVLLVVITIREVAL